MTVRQYLADLKTERGEGCFIRMVLANDNPMVVRLIEVHDDYIVGKGKLDVRPEIIPIGSIVHFRDVADSKEHTW